MNHDTISRLSEIAAVWSYEKYSKTETGYTREHWQSCKLAELIIEECLNNIKEWRDAADEHIDKKEYWNGYQHGCDDSVAAFIEYFEVEE